MSIHLGNPTRVQVDGHDLTKYLANPITGLYRHDGSLRAVRVDYMAMTPLEREAIVAWVAAHGVDPGRVPVRTEIGYDPETDEWRFPVAVRNANGRKYIDRETGDVAMRTVRRRRFPTAARQLEQAWGSTRG